MRDGEILRYAQNDNSEGARQLRLEGEGAGEDYRELAGIGVAHFADAVEFFAAALQFRFDRAQVLRRDEQDHTDAHVEGAQQFVALDVT